MVTSLVVMYYFWKHTLVRIYLGDSCNLGVVVVFIILSQISTTYKPDKFTAAKGKLTQSIYVK